MAYPRSRRSLGSVRGSYSVALAVLAAGLVMTYVTYRVTLANETAAREARFTRYAEQVTNTIRARFAQYQAVLDSSAGLFLASDRVTRRVWQEFSDIVGLESNYPGISAFEYIAYVRRSDLPAFLYATRADDAPDFRLTPSVPADFYCPITFVAPRTKLFAQGYDPCHGTKAGATILLTSADNGQFTLSAPLDLTDQNGHVHRGVVAARPMYRKGADISTVAARHAALYGWVDGTLPVDRLVAANVIPEGVDMDVRIEDTALQGREAVIYDNGTGSLEQSEYSWLPLVRPQSSYFTTLVMGGRNWRLDFAEPPGIAWTALLVALAGIMVSVPVALLVLNLGLTRSRALRIADQMSESFREQEQLLSSIAGNISDGIYRSTPDKGMIYANEALARMFGYPSADELIHAAGPILYADPRRRKELEELLDAHGQYHEAEVEYQRKDGTRFFGLNSAVTVKDPGGRALYYDGLIADVTERKRAEAKVYHLAHYDSLTGLPNRALLRDRLDQAMHDAHRRGTKLAVLFLDLDRFKTVNDSLGHDVGDELLKAVAGRLTQELRSSDTVGRPAGDEFLVVLRDVDDAAAVGRIAEKILESVARPYLLGRHELHVTPSIGISLFPDDAAAVELLLHNADAAMYHAKDSGRFNFQFFTPEMNARAYERLSLETSLRQALERGEFSLVYQPQVHIKSGRIVGVEALLRWRSAERGLVPPSVFVPILEASGLIAPVGEWVLLEACRQNRAWQQQGLQAVPMAVNISPFQFRGRNMADVVGRALKETGLAPEHLELEFTESALMQDTRELGETIHRLKALGVRLAIDDFGTGYSSLSYLKRFRIDKIKIDRSFVQDIGVDVDDAAITGAIISLARSLKVTVVAEGVETDEQLEFMRARDCDELQGYYFSPPVAPDEFAAMLGRDRRLEHNSRTRSQDEVGL